MCERPTNRSPPRATSSGVERERFPRTVGERQKGPPSQTSLEPKEPILFGFSDDTFDMLRGRVHNDARGGQWPRARPRDGESPGSGASASGCGRYVVFSGERPRRRTPVLGPRTLKVTTCGGRIRWAFVGFAGANGTRGHSRRRCTLTPCAVNGPPFTRDRVFVARDHPHTPVTHALTHPKHPLPPTPSPRSGGRVASGGSAGRPRCQRSRR